MIFSTGGQAWKPQNSEDRLARIQFAFDHLKIRVTHAHFGLYVEKQESKTLAKLTR
jgi:hypothetical protein